MTGMYSRRRKLREYSDHPRLCVCDSIILCVCPLDKTKTAETKITNTGIVHIPRPLMVKRSKVNVRVRRLSGRRELCTLSSASSSYSGNCSILQWVNCLGLGLVCFVKDDVLIYVTVVVNWLLVLLICYIC